jgi:hypothetical protein
VLLEQLIRINAKNCPKPSTLDLLSSCAPNPLRLINVGGGGFNANRRPKVCKREIDPIVAKVEPRRRSKTKL